MRVAETVTRKAGEEFVKPGGLVEVRFVKGQSLSLTASRLLALMILTAGGDAWRDVTHRMRKADIRRGHKGNERIGDMLEELHRTLFAEDDLSWRGRRATKRFSLIQASWEEVEGNGRETGWLEWQFTPDARRLIQESETYAVMNRQAVLGFRSAYALKLYEEGALRLHRRQPVWKVDLIGLRAALGIDPEKYGDFAQLRRKVLNVARDEIGQLAHFTCDWEEFRRGRAVSELEFRFTPKGAPAQLATVEENARHGAGRRARREAIVEQVVTPSPSPAAVAAPSPVPATSDGLWERFPSGRLRFGETEAAARLIGQRHGGGWDVDLIAEAYRAHMGDRLGRLSGAKLERSWRGFCEAFFARRGRP
ncbi:replication initiation protein [Amaricoccus solimangrovi]|uniref:Replication initiation protein n=2 Tax=Amaricoccus solimangrovi TaxID=2589815 RepID=A0A501WIE2_9RHOB|nr:replication initiation protein [Amaricoccus solimangrovi]